RGIRIQGQPGQVGSRPGRMERGRSQAVHTAPAQIRLIREAENPWYEVTLIEGRNRQIRRMFEEVGHHVEKIKRIRYGPLTLDVEPGECRELSPGEVESLRRSKNSKTHHGGTETRRKSRRDWTRKD